METATTQYLHQPQLVPGLATAFGDRAPAKTKVPELYAVMYHTFISTIGQPPVKVVQMSGPFNELEEAVTEGILKDGVIVKLTTVSVKAD